MRYRAIFLTAVLVLAGPAVAAAGAVSAEIQAIRGAIDPSTAVTAYAAGVSINPDSVELHEAYVRRMVDFGLAELAYEQAWSLVALDPDKALGWAVIAFVSAQKGHMTDAFSAAVLAADGLADDPFVGHLAGQLTAWYDKQSDKSALGEELGQGAAELRSKLGDKEAFKQGYEDAKAAFEAEPSESEPAETPPAEESAYDAGQTYIYTSFIYYPYYLPSAGYLSYPWYYYYPGYYDYPRHYYYPRYSYYPRHRQHPHRRLFFQYRRRPDRRRHGRPDRHHQSRQQSRQHIRRDGSSLGRADFGRTGRFYAAPSIWRSQRNRRGVGRPDDKGGRRRSEALRRGRTRRRTDRGLQRRPAARRRTRTMRSPNVRGGSSAAPARGRARSAVSRRPARPRTPTARPRRWRVESRRPATAATAAPRRQRMSSPRGQAGPIRPTRPRSVSRSPARRPSADRAPTVRRPAVRRPAARSFQNRPARIQPARRTGRTGDRMRLGGRRGSRGGRRSGGRGRR